MDIDRIRKDRLRDLVDLHFGGKVRALADALAMKAEQLYRWLTKNPDADTRRFSEESARSIERKLNLIPLALDQQRGNSPFYPDRPAVEPGNPNELERLSNTNRVAEPAIYGWNVQPRAPWPFPLVSSERYYALSEDDRALVQQRINEAIALCELRLIERAASKKRPA